MAILEIEARINAIAAGRPSESPLLEGLGDSLQAITESDHALELAEEAAEDKADAQVLGHYSSSCAR